MTSQQPAAILVMDAETVVPVVVSGATCCPAIRAAGHAFQPSKKVSHQCFSPPPLRWPCAGDSAVRPPPPWCPPKASASAFAVHPLLLEAVGFPVSFAGDGISARDQSARTE